MATLALRFSIDNWPVSSNGPVEFHIPFSANWNLVLSHLRRNPLSIRAIVERVLRIKRLGIQVLNIGVAVREAPGDSLVVSNNHQRRARHREAFHIPSWCRQV